MAMMLRILSAACLAAFAGQAKAQSACDAAIAGLSATLQAGDAASVMAAWSGVAAATDCSPTVVMAARGQTSAALARLAQTLLADGKVDAAEAVVLQAPGMHWAVQAVRGDIAASRGQRDEAAKLYNAALDTLGDPGLTTQSKQLEPVAERLASLAQENMMLAGTMRTSVARGGEATGVMGMMSRGLAVEKVPTPATQAPASNDQTYVAPAPEAPEYNIVAAAAAKIEKVFLPIHFDFDSDTLDAAGVREAISLSDFLKANHVGLITIIGHTDDVGDQNYNLDLSLRRAENLAAFLVSDGVTTAIDVVGKGEFEPPIVVDASIYSTEEFRTIARRVEVAFGY